MLEILEAKEIKNSDEAKNARNLAEFEVFFFGDLERLNASELYKNLRKLVKAFLVF